MLLFFVPLFFFCVSSLFLGGPNYGSHNNISIFTYKYTYIHFFSILF